jgi:hypothetical protein
VDAGPYVMIGVGAAAILTGIALVTTAGQAWRTEAPPAPAPPPTAAPLFPSRARGSTLFTVRF